ncbi:meiotic recombination protein SPO11 [Nematostella vectensis]|uniref:meiotic recombination protein SPO11 n=1 Tax=Nematostella vectensis TaxID=45351 RepID=UPI00207738BF|nr:meiotic recombination protein SPO11 [Nematostella vectensis]
MANSRLETSGEDFWLQVDALKKDLNALNRVEELHKLVNVESREAIIQLKDCTREEALKKLEKVTEELIYTICNGDAPFLSSNNRTSWKNIRFNPCVGLEMVDHKSASYLKFESINSIGKFATTIRILSICQNLLQEDRFATKRDVYYTDTVFFGNQNVVDDIVDNLSCMLQVPRHSLRILASSKGLISGHVRYREYDGTYVDCTCLTRGVAVSSHVDGIYDLYSDAKVVLVVEKEATYHRLLDDGLLEKLNPCIMITGKGYPDVNTRQMVHRLWCTLHVPVMALVDADPHGIEILSVYKYGSKALSFNVHDLTVPTIRWLGVWPSEVDRLSIPEHVRIPLTERDRSKCHALLKRPFMDSHPAWRQEIEHMLTKGYKAEMQALSTIATSFLSDTYIALKIRNGRWI